MGIVNKTLIGASLGAIMGILLAFEFKFFTPKTFGWPWHEAWIVVITIIGLTLGFAWLLILQRAH